MNNRFERTVVFVDHSSDLGGGQLGLLRHFREPAPFRRRLVVLGDGELAERARELGIDVVVLHRAKSLLSKVTVARRLRDAVEACTPDLVIANSLTSANILSLQRPRHSKVIAYLREDLSVLSVPRGLKRFLMMSLLLPRFHGFLVNSRFTGTTIPRNLRHKPSLLAYPISGANFDEPPGFPAGPLTVVSLSRLAPWKGIHVLLEAASRLAEKGRVGDFRFLIAGDSAHADPRYGDSLRERYQHEVDNVVFLGHVSDPLSLIDESHVLALCSTRPEPFGQVVPQALLRRRVVLATAGGGPVEVLGPTAAGILIAPDDVNALVEALEFLAGNREELRTIAERGRLRGADFVDHATTTMLTSAIVQFMDVPGSGEAPREE